MTVKSKFNIVSEGYEIKEVNKFLKIVTSEFEKLIDKNQGLEREIKTLTAKISQLENETNSVDFYKDELDSYLEKRKIDKESLELELSTLEEKVEEYQKAINTLFHDHIEIINKIK